MPDDNGTYDMFAARFAEQMMVNKLKKLFKDQPWFHLNKLQDIFKDIPKATLTSLLLRVVNNQSIIFENGNLQGHIIFRNGLFLFQPNKIQDNAIPISFRYGRYPVKRDSYNPTREIIRAKNTSSLKYIRNFWNTAVSWVNSWCKPSVAITKFIPEDLSDAIVDYVERDDKKKENIKTRLEMLQWWGHAIAGEGISDLNKVAKEFIWDSFFKGPEHIQLLNEDLDSAKSAGSEQVLAAGSIKAIRYMDIGKKEPIYQCSGAPCPPSVLKLFTDSKIDEVVNAKANKKVSANPYGFMVVWENDIMFKTNDAKNEEGKPPGSGAACSIVSNVKGHRMKLVELGKILAEFHKDNKSFLYIKEKETMVYALSEENLKSLNGAPSYCALTEIIMRWMDLRKDSYGGKRYFYRPLSSYYSGHKSKK
jgi:hypothetical protein